MVMEPWSGMVLYNNKFYGVTQQEETEEREFMTGPCYKCFQ